MKLKKIHVGLAVLLIVTFLMGCGNSKENDTKEDNSSTTSEYEVALIIDAVSGAIDDRSFTQGAWEGIEKFAEQYGKTTQYYRSTEDSTDGYLNAIQMAVDNGATAVVCPGYSYEAAIFQAQDKYPDVYFILLDGTPQNGDYTEYKTADNTYSVVFAEEQAGYLAGYAVVKDGETKLGFMGGMAVPAVVRFGYGFVQGAQAAAEEMGLNEGDIQMKFGYTGNFEATPENQTKAASWYEAGTDVIFSCGGLILNSVTAAAEANGSGKVIGVDVDQQGESETVITSAMKMLSDTVYNALDAKEKGTFPGGQNDRLGIKEDAVGLPNDFSRFNSFDEAQYNVIYEKIKGDDSLLGNIKGNESEDGTEITLADIKEICPLIEIDEVN